MSVNMEKEMEEARKMKKKSIEGGKSGAKRGEKRWGEFSLLDWSGFCFEVFVLVALIAGILR